MYRHGFCGLGPGFSGDFQESPFTLSRVVQHRPYRGLMPHLHFEQKHTVTLITLEIPICSCFIQLFFCPIHRTWAAQLECWYLQNGEAKVTCDVAVASRGSSKSLLECQGSFVCPLMFLYGSQEDLCSGLVVIQEVTPGQFLHNEVVQVELQKNVSLLWPLFKEGTTSALTSFPFLLREDILPSIKKGSPCFPGRHFVPAIPLQFHVTIPTLSQFWKGR